MTSHVKMGVRNGLGTSSRVGGICVCHLARASLLGGAKQKHSGKQNVGN